MLKQFQIICFLFFFLKERYHESDLRLSKIVFQRNDDKIENMSKNLPLCWETKTHPAKTVSKIGKFPLEDNVEDVD